MVTEARLEFEEEKEKLSERQSALNSFQTIGFKGRTFVNQLLPERYEQQKSLKQAQEEYKKAEAKSITERETELSTYEKNVLVPYEKKVEMYEGVVAILQRQAQGKSGNFYGEPEKQQLANQILAENPEFAKAVKAGREARSYARSQGYANIEAYKEALAMKEYFNTQWAKGLDTPATVISRVSTLEPTKVSSISEKSTESNVFNIASSKTDSSSLFAFGYERPEVKESGVLFVTPEEAKSLSKSTFSSYWTLESKDIDSAIQEASFASGVSQRSGAFGLINTRGQFEFNRQQIEARKDLFSQYTNLIEDFKSSPESYKGKVGVNVEQVSGGEQISLTSEFFESNIDTQKAYSNALSKAKTQYGNLPSSEQKKLYAGGVGVGAVQVGVGVLEFQATLLGNLGVQKIDSEEFKNLSTFDKIVGRRAYIGGELGNIRTLPRTQTETKFLESPTGYIKETAQSPEFLGSALVIIPAVISGVKGIYTSYKAGGIKGAFLDTASAISPIKIKEGIYAPRVDSSTKLNVESIKYTDKSGLTTRIFSGKDIYGDIKVGGVEQYKLVNGKAVGMGYLSTETPYINIQYGGAQVTTGVRSTLQPYVYGSTGGGTASINTILGNSQLSALITEQLSVQSGKSNLWVSKGIDIYSGEEGVSIYSNLNKFVKVNSGGISEVGTETGITKFISGQTKPIYETLVDETGFIYRPSGKYELSPSVYGTEYDLNVLFRNAYGNTYRISGGGASSSGGVSGSSALNSLQTQTGQSLNLPVNIPKVISTPSTTPTILLPKPEVKQTTQNVPTFSTQVKLQTPELLTDTKVATDVKVDVGVKNLVTNLQIPELKSKSKTAQIVAPVSVASQVQVPVANQIQRIIQVQKLSLKQASAQTALSPAFAFPSASTFADIIPTNDYIPVLPLSFGGGFEERALKIARIPSAPSGRDYTPSFSALFFKISGKTKKTGKTGLEFRPITKGFNLNKFLGGGNRVIKVRRVKI